MSLLDKKQQIYGNIAAARTISEGLPNLKLNSSIPSINNGGNSISFLSDLIKSLIGYDVMVTTIVNILTHSLTDIEREIKIALKTNLKNIVSCGVNPSLPNFIKSTGSGIIIEVSKVDLMDLFKTDPNSIGGRLIYNDVSNPLSNSTDFNTFLYAVIQGNGTTFTWKNIFDITFNSIGTGNIPNNTFLIKANHSYDNKTLTDLNNDFIDSLTLFNSSNIVNRLIDIIFGSISININKTKKQLENEAKINTVIDNMVNADADDSIDDSYFTFTNDEIYTQQIQSDLRKNGIIKLACCNKIAASVPVGMLINFNNQMSGTTNVQQQEQIISTNLNAMAEQNTVNSTNPSDSISIKLNFIQNLIDNLIKAIVSVVLSPKVAMIFLINYKIIYGPSATYNDGIDFIKKNKNLFNSIMKKVSELIIKILLVIALKQIALLVADTVAVRETEKAKNQLSQILSLVGVSTESIRLIQGLT